MIGKYDWRSEMATEIFTLIEKFERQIDVYDISATEAVADYFAERGTEWVLSCTDWPDMTGGVCYFSWIENGGIHMEGFDYIR